MPFKMKSSEHKKYKDYLHILVCKILIWEPADKNTIDVDDPAEDKCLTLTECESVEIEESYKKLIGTATVKFPRGTIIKRTQTANDIEENGTTTVYTERLQDGTITEKRAGTSTAKPSDFKVGQRIRIYLGYYMPTSYGEGEKFTFRSEAERKEYMLEKGLALPRTPDFDGYIVKCSVSTPIEIKCENLASGLKRKNCRKIITGNHATVNDFLKEGGKYDLLKGTGLKLHPDTANLSIDIGKVQLSEDLTVADLLTEWSKYHLYCFVRADKDSKPCIKVGRSYFSTKSAESIVNDDGSSNGELIQFDYHVAEDNLTLMNTDPKFLAVSAEGFKIEGGKEIKYSITIRLNPEWTGTTDTKHKKFQLLNETQLSKKAQKLGATLKSSVKDKVDLSQYTVIPYAARKIGITEEELIKEAEAYFDGYNMNGIEGSITVFGDYHLQSGMKVELLDIREPEKNGWYLIEEVNTKFGTNGYRQTLKLPYCIARPEKEEEK